MKSTTNAALRIVSVAMLCGGIAAPMIAFARDKPYTEGTVWTVGMVRVKPGMFDVYMHDVLQELITKLPRVSSLKTSRASFQNPLSGSGRKLTLR